MSLIQRNSEETPHPADLNDASGQRREWKPDPETLILVFVNGSTHRHAVVPFPETYEAAEPIAIKTFRRYMEAEDPKIILRCSIKNREDGWVWADITPENWKTTLKQYPKEVGVFELPQPESRDTFLHGKLYFTVGASGSSNIDWQPKVEGNRDPTIIDRPIDYEAAKRVALEELSRKVAIRYPRSAIQSFKFVEFIDSHLLLWKIIPEAAETDDLVWRAYVPKPGGVLGAIAELKD